MVIKKTVVRFTVGAQILSLRHRDQNRSAESINRTASSFRM